MLSFGEVACLWHGDSHALHLSHVSAETCQFLLGCDAGGSAYLHIYAHASGCVRLEIFRTT